MTEGIAGPLVLTGIMTGEAGESAVLNMEVQSLKFSLSALGEQWGDAGLFATEGRTTKILGTRVGYWGTVISSANETGINLVANDANPGGFS